MKPTRLILSLAVLALVGCGAPSSPPSDPRQAQAEKAVVTARKVTETATTDAVQAARLAVGTVEAPAATRVDPPTVPAKVEADDAIPFEQRAATAIANARQLRDRPAATPAASAN